MEGRSQLMRRLNWLTSLAHKHQDKVLSYMPMYDVMKLIYLCQWFLSSLLQPQNQTSSLSKN